jgi:predicted DNA-binding protein (UPF0251 family)
MEKDKKMVKKFEKFAKKMDVSQPTFKSSWNSCMQKERKIEQVFCQILLWMWNSF